MKKNLEKFWFFGNFKYILQSYVKTTWEGVPYMSFVDRMKLEEKRISSTEFLMKNCFQCKFWNHFVKHDFRYCHKCVNNLRISIRRGKGFSIEGLYDYYNASDSVVKGNKHMN